MKIIKTQYVYPEKIAGYQQTWYSSPEKLDSNNGLISEDFIWVPKDEILWSLIYPKNIGIVIGDPEYFNWSPVVAKSFPARARLYNGSMVVLNESPEEEEFAVRALAYVENRKDLSVEELIQAQKEIRANITSLNRCFPSSLVSILSETEERLWETAEKLRLPVVIE